MSLLNTRQPLVKLSIQHLASRGRQRSVHSKTVAVRLTENVLGLGIAGDVVQVNPGRMRSALFVQGKAIYIPWKRKSELSAYVTTQQEIQRQRYLGFDQVATSRNETDQHPREASSSSSADRADIEQQLANLATLIVLPARTIADSINLFGSVALPDIQDALQLSAGVRLRWSEATLKSGKVLNSERVRELGKYEVVASGGGELAEKQVVVEVVPLESS